jgi:hypothetical protein
MSCVHALDHGGGAPWGSIEAVPIVEILKAEQTSFVAWNVDMYPANLVRFGKRIHFRRETATMSVLPAGVPALP